MLTYFIMSVIWIIFFIAISYLMGVSIIEDFPQKKKLIISIFIITHILIELAFFYGYFYLRPMIFINKSF